MNTKPNRSGVALVGLLLLLALVSHARAASEKVLYRFHGADGWAGGNVVVGTDGSLYGTTSAGGTNSCPATGFGCGVVFRVIHGANGKWQETVLHDFAGSDGQFPNGALVADTAGNLYGTTVDGGTGCGYGCGVVFQLKRGGGGKWTYNVLHFFAATDGAEPYAGLIFDSHGNLYGTASAGGNISACYNEGGCGVVFKLTPDGKSNWTETTVYAFDGTDGGDRQVPSSSTPRATCMGRRRTAGPTSREPSSSLLQGKTAPGPKRCGTPLATVPRMGTPRRTASPSTAWVTCMALRRLAAC